MGVAKSLFFYIPTNSDQRRKHWLLIECQIHIYSVLSQLICPTKLSETSQSSTVKILAFLQCHTVNYAVIFDCGITRVSIIDNSGLCRGHQINSYIEAEWCIYASVYTIICSDNSLASGQHQAIIWTNDGILLTGHLGTNFNEILIKIYTFSFKKMYLNMLSGKWRPFCLSPNVLIHWNLFITHPIITPYHI